jgi:putative transposase
MKMIRNTRSNSNIVFDCKYHVVFCPKYRKKILKDGVDVRLKELLHKKALELDSEIIEMEIMPDHVHLLLACDPQFGVHRLVKQLKGYTAKLLRDEFKHLKSTMPNMWTNSYFVATTGGVNLETIKKYIETQKERGE